MFIGCGEDSLTEDNLEDDCDIDRKSFMESMNDNPVCDQSIQQRNLETNEIETVAITWCEYDNEGYVKETYHQSPTLCDKNDDIFPMPPECIYSKTEYFYGSESYEFCISSWSYKNIALQGEEPVYQGFYERKTCNIIQYSDMSAHCRIYKEKGY